MMIVCAEIKRVLKKTGSFWLNMGDTYSGSGKGYGSVDPKYISQHSVRNEMRPQQFEVNLPSKCLLGIPWRLVLRLIDEQGWILRNAGIWNKPNSMPSSTKDRLSNSYEFLFHLVKNTKPQYCWNEKTGLMADRKPKELEEGIDWEWRECSKCGGTSKVEEKECPRCKGTGKIKHSFWHSLGYWYDLDAIREAYTEPLNRWGGPKTKETDRSKGDQFAVQERPGRERRPHGAGKNPGDVWTIPTQPRPESHFATFPDKLCIKPILATCPLEICKKCGKARVRMVKREILGEIEDKPYCGDGQMKSGGKVGTQGTQHSTLGQQDKIKRETIGWTDCGCNAGWDSGVLLDPFAGRGTSLIMVKKLGRHYVGYELKKEYADMAERELEEIDPLFGRK